MTRPKIYIAAASLEVARAERVVRGAKQLGATVVGEWAGAIREHGSEGIKLEPHERNRRSAEIRLAIREADALLYLVPRVGVETKGGWWEAGFAEALGKICVASVHYCDPKPFILSAADERIGGAAFRFFDNDATAIATTIEMAKRAA